ncbi:MAG: hypothetical protein MJB14_00210 [Spirochaetes bacterium]|nr:hypothetical protein [Spirochaetota bacterium]
MKKIFFLIFIVLFISSCSMNKMAQNESQNDLQVQAEKISEEKAGSYLFTGSNGQPVAKILYRNLKGSSKFPWHYRHEHIWFSDGTNYGFFEDSKIRADNVDFSEYTYSDGDLRYCSGDNYYIEYDVTTMQTAIDNVSASWQYKYNLFTNNCQHFAQAVHDEYVRLTSN